MSTSIATAILTIATISIGMIRSYIPFNFNWCNNHIISPATSPEPDLQFGGATVVRIIFEGNDAEGLHNDGCCPIRDRLTQMLLSCIADSVGRSDFYSKYSKNF